MPRAARQIIDGSIYQVMNRGFARQEIFHDCDDYFNFMDLLSTAKQRYPIRMYAYCLMPNHFHLLVQPVTGIDLSRFMHWLQTSYARRYHAKYKRSGRLWQSRFKSHPITDDDHLMTVHRYVEGNPLRAGLVGSAVEYPWSSHRLLASAGEDLHRLPKLDEPPLEVPGDWTQYVDTALTGAEKERARARLMM